MNANYGRFLGVSVVAAIVLSIPLSARCEDAGATDKTKGSYVGKVDNIDLKARTIRIKADFSEMTFEVPKDARIATRDKDSAVLGDLSEGIEVRVDYTTEDGVRLAQKIETMDREKSKHPEPIDRSSTLSPDRY